MEIEKIKNKLHSHHIATLMDYDRLFLSFCWEIYAKTKGGSILKYFHIISH